MAVDSDNVALCAFSFLQAGLGDGHWFSAPIDLQEASWISRALLCV